jgi:hydroxyacylglutathione hydrolase
MLQIHPIPAFDDNYFWLIQPNDQDTEAYIVDPGAVNPVYEALSRYSLTLAGILITHHHHDHIDGAMELSKTFQIPIYGPESSKIPQITHYLYEGDNILLGTSRTKIIALPGHTRDHIGYFIEPNHDQPLLFGGDTLFAAGCGRLFDGTAEQLFQSLQRIKTLPDDTLIYCAHEYTLNNIRFALHIESNNTHLIARQSNALQIRQHHSPTIPNVLHLEKQTNPFLRCHLPQIRQRVEQLSQLSLATELEVFTQMRRLKDQF